ncbi:MAG: sulfur oxidation c-type cytochrome SoxX [Rhodobacteraceae bacterium]|nr:sulfur oxidation c-type cytochrome SoxX [Paracoccaceae bacterium]
MRHKLILLAGLSAAVASASFAADVAPAGVSFGEDGIVNVSLTGVPGDPVAGKDAFVNRKQGNCLACHINDDASEHSFHGEVGPPLNGAADRWDEAQLRGIVINSKLTFEDTIMPSFYRLENGSRTMEKFVGKTILTAQQVEDIVAYLGTLKEE